MLLHELGHVDGGHEAFAAEHQIRDTERSLGLSDTGWPDQQEDAHRLLGRLESGLGRPHSGGDSRQRMILPLDPLPQYALHIEQGRSLVGDHLADRDAGPVRDDACDDIRRDLDGHQRILALECGQGCGSGRQLSPQLGLFGSAQLHGRRLLRIRGLGDFRRPRTGSRIVSRGRLGIRARLLSQRLDDLRREQLGADGKHRLCRRLLL